MDLYIRSNNNNVCIITLCASQLCSHARTDATADVAGCCMSSLRRVREQMDKPLQFIRLHATHTNLQNEPAERTRPTRQLMQLVCPNSNYCLACADSHNLTHFRILTHITKSLADPSGSLQNDLI